MRVHRVRAAGAVLAQPERELPPAPEPAVALRNPSRLALVDGRTARVTRVVPVPGAARHLPNSPYGLAFDPARRRLWVTLTATNQPVGFDLSAPTAMARATPFTTLPTLRQPNSIAVDPTSGRVFVAGATDSGLQVVDPR